MFIAQFDEAVHINYTKCATTPTDIVLNSCSGLNIQNLPNAYQQFSSIECLEDDGTIKSVNITPTIPTVKTVYIMSVNNTQNCDGLYLSIINHNGVGDIKTSLVFIGDTIIQSNNLGSLSICCGILSNGLQQIWDGFIVITVEITYYTTTPTTINYSFLFGSSDKLPTKYFSNLVELDIYDSGQLIVPANNCNGTQFANYGFTGKTTTTICDWSIKPTNDPLYDYHLRNTQNLIDNRIVWELIGFNLTTPTIAFKNIYYSASNTQVKQLDTVEYNVACNSSLMGMQVNQLDQNLNISIDYVGDVQSELELKYQAAIAPSLSLNWLSCIKQVNISNLKTCNWLDTLIQYRKARDEQNLYSKCYSSLIGKSCTSEYYCPDSKCQPNPSSGPLESIFYRTCSIHCNTDSDCLSGSCIIGAEGGVCYQFPIGDSVYQQGTYIKDSLLSCITDNTFGLEPFFKYNILSFLQLPPAAPSGLIRSGWGKYTTDIGCSNPPYWGTNTYSDSNCPLAQTCNWYHCDSNHENWCTDGDAYYGPGCTNLLPSGRDSYFCGNCGDQSTTEVCAEVSQNDTCIISETFGTFGESFGDFYHVCQDIYNGTYDNLAYMCWGPARTKESCTPSRFCSGDRIIPLNKLRVSDAVEYKWKLFEGQYCYPLCYSDLLNSSSCINLGYRWFSNYCEIPANSYESCTGLYGGQWYPGSIWLPKKLSSSNECRSFCPDDQTKNTKVECEAGYHCSNNLCSGCNQTECQTSGFCSAAPGCYIPHTVNGDCSYNAKQFGLPDGLMLHWKPEGCLITYPPKLSPLVNEYYCSSINGSIWRSHSDWLNITKQQCEQMYPICVGVGMNLGQASSLANALPWDGIIPCSKDSIVIYPYQWIQGQWVRNNRGWMNLQWMRRQMVPLYNITTLVSESKFNSIFFKASAQREVDIIRFGLYCTFSSQIYQYKTILQPCSANLTNIIAVDKLCSALPFIYNHSEFGYLEISQTFQLPKFACTEATIKTLDKKNIPQYRVDMFYLNTNKQSDYYNQDSIVIDNVVVGKVISDGIQVEIPIEYVGRWAKVDSSILACLLIPVSNYSNVQLYNGTSILSSIQKQNHLCAPIKNQTTVLYLVGIKNDSTHRYYDLLQAGEIAIVVIVIILYTTFISLTGILLYRDPNKIDSTILSILLTRSVYLSLVLSGAGIDYPNKDIIFSEFSAFLYLFLVFLLVEGNRFKYYRIAAIGTMSIIEIITIVIVFAYPSTSLIVGGCQSSTMLSPKEIVGVIHFIFYVLVSIIMGLEFDRKYIISYIGLGLRIIGFIIELSRYSPSIVGLMFYVILIELLVLVGTQYQRYILN